MEYHEIHNFIREKQRKLSNTTSTIEDDDFGDSSDSSPDTPLDRHLKKTHHHARHYYQTPAPIQSWWPFVSTRTEESSLEYHPHDAPRTNRMNRPRPFIRARSTDRSLHTRRFTTSKRARVFRRLGLTWKRPQQRPIAPAIKKSNNAQSPDPLATIISSLTLINRISNQIHTLQCLTEIQIQYIEDHQRDIGFYTDRLDQLQQDTMYLYRKVLAVTLTKENDMDPLHDQIQHTVTSLAQLHRSHGGIVAEFMGLVQRRKSTLESSQARVAAAQLQIARWDAITFWSWLVFVIALASLFVWWMITFAGLVVTLVFVALLVWLVYDTS